MARELAGKVAIGTGGSGGIGSAICKRLAQDGAKVVVHYGGHANSANEVVEAVKTKGDEALQSPGHTRRHYGYNCVYGE